MSPKGLYLDQFHVMQWILIMESPLNGSAGNVFFVKTMLKMEYTSKCNFLVLKTVYIMTQMVHCGYAVAIA